MLEIGEVLRYIDEDDNMILERVLWLEREQNQIVVIGISNTLYGEKQKEIEMPVIHKLDEYEMKLESGDIECIQIKNNVLESREALESNPELKASDKKICEERKKRDKLNKTRDERFNDIKELVTDEPRIYTKERGELIRKQVEKTGKSRKYINKCLTMYWRGGKVRDALISSRHKPQGIGSRIKDKEYGVDDNKITKNVRKIIEKCYKKYYLDVKNATLEEAYTQMLNEYFVDEYGTENGILIPISYTKFHPSPKQFQRWGQAKYNAKERLQRKYGKRIYDLKHRAVTRRNVKVARGPGYRYQIDATILDIELIDEYTGEPIGRPIAFIVVDEFSRMVVGVHVGLESASWESASMAIYNITRNHVEYAAEYGVKLQEDEWENVNLPSVLVADRGELCNYLNQSLVANLWTGIDYMAPYRPDWKGIVERKMKELNDLGLKYEAGSTYGFKNERGERNPRRHAKNTLKNITAIIIREVVEMNHRYVPDYKLDTQMIQDGVRPIASELWKWGMKNRTGMGRWFDKDSIIMNLMYNRTVSLTSRGVKFKNCSYTSKYLHDIGVFDELKQKGAQQIVVHFDPRNMGKLYYYYEDEFIELEAIDQFGYKMYLENMETYAEDKKEQDKQGKDSNRLLHGKHKKLKEHERENVEPNVTNETLKNIKQNREKALEKQRQQSSFRAAREVEDFTESYGQVEYEEILEDDMAIFEELKKADSKER